jgi:phosphomannomutase
LFRRGEHRHRVVLGKDTRLSGYMIETAQVAGFTSVGTPLRGEGGASDAALHFFTVRPSRTAIQFAEVEQV